MPLTHAEAPRVRFVAGCLDSGKCALVSVYPPKINSVASAARLFIQGLSVRAVLFPIETGGGPDRTQEIPGLCGLGSRSPQVDLLSGSELSWSFVREHGRDPHLVG